MIEMTETVWWTIVIVLLCIAIACIIMLIISYFQTKKAKQLAEELLDLQNDDTEKVIKVEADEIIVEETVQPKQKNKIEEEINDEEFLSALHSSDIEKEEENK